MGGILWVLALLGAVAAWIVSGVMASQRGGTKGRKFYFIQLAFCIAAIALLFMIIVVPVMNCSGFLCGLGEILAFIGLGTLVLLVWPLILIPIIKNKYRGKAPASSTMNDELIDDLDNEIE